MKRKVTPQALEQAQVAFEEKLARLRSERVPVVREIRADFDVPGFCKHGIPMHCPHCLKGAR